MQRMGKTAALVSSAAALVLVTGCGGPEEPDVTAPSTATATVDDSRLAEAEQRAEDAEAEAAEQAEKATQAEQRARRPRRSWSRSGQSSRRRRRR